MSQQELLSTIAWALDAGEIPYLVTGDLGACLHGALRPPCSFDLVLDLPADRADDFCGAFPPPAFYLSEIDVAEALARRQPFRVMSLVDCMPIDCTLHSGGEFDQSRFLRRMRVALGGVEISFPSAEDALLELLSRGAAAQETAAEIYAAQRQALDVGYLAHWADHLGLADRWRLLSAAPVRR